MERPKLADPTVLDAWASLLRAHAVLTAELDRELQQAHDLPLDWYDVLYQLAATDGPVTMGELSDALLIGGSRCTRRVDQMEGAGLVERRANAHDRRVIEVRLTAAGRAKQRRCALTHVRGIERVFGGHLDADLVPRMSRALTSMVEAVEQSEAAEAVEAIEHSEPTP